MLNFACLAKKMNFSGDGEPREAEEKVEIATLFD